MIQPQCPACHQKTALAGNTVFCPSCGWNRDAAVSSLQQSMNSLPIAIFMFGGFAAFLYWGLKFNRVPALMIFACFPALAIVLNFFLQRSKLAKLKAMPAPSQPPTVPANFNLAAQNAPPGAQTFPPSSRDEALLRTPAPRQVRMSKGGRITMWVAGFGLSLFVLPAAIRVYTQWTMYHSFSNSRGLVWMVVFEGLVALAAFGIWRGQVKECDLLEHGEAAMGRVLRQWRDDKQNSSIDYEFTDFLGSSHRGGALDRTNQLFPGMPVIVFYDRDNPKRQIAYCSTLHEVILPSTAALAPEELATKR